MIRSVLVAGFHTNDNQAMNYCDSLFLKPIHVPEWNAIKGLPTNCDAAIIAITATSHLTTSKVKELYQGKPIYWYKNGISSFRHEFEEDVFGQDILKKLRNFNDIVDDGKFTRNKSALTVSARTLWIMARFLEPGQVFNSDVLGEKIAKLLKRDDIRVSINSMIRNYQDSCFIRDEKNIKQFTFKGIPRIACSVMEAHGLPVDGFVIVEDVKSKWRERNEPKEEIQEPVKLKIAPEPAPIVIEDNYDPRILERLQQDSAASTDLLLSAMERQLAEMDRMREMIQTEIPKLIQTEIRGITKLLGSLVPKLQGLNPEDIEKVDQMLNLFLGMRK